MSDSHTGSEANFRLAKQWLQECASSHSSCPRPAETELPTRVLDVGPADGSKPPVLCATYGKHDTYVALSHCWGRVAPLTTTTKTLEDRLACISMPSLPKTFQEAVVIARSMGVRYLWIDSLCIIQNSPVDWATESARMGEYFSKCLFAIAATDAADSSQGCFRSRDPWAYQPSLMSIPLPHVAVESPNPTKFMPDYDFPPEKRLLHITPRKVRSRTPVLFPLSQRAWTLQETFLSPRTLDYQKMQLAWSCKTGKADENNFNIEHSSSSTGVDGDWTRLLINNDSADKLSPQVYASWYSMVGRYSNRSLTSEEDILPAISGLASRFQTLTGSRYLAGLWEDDLSRGLLWTVKGDIRHGGQRYRAPSWSWASINLTSISYESGPKSDINPRSDWFRIESVRVGIPTKNPFGEVDGGALEVTGRVRELVTKPPMMLGRKGTLEYRKTQLQDPYTSENTGTIFFDEPRSSSDSQLRVSCLPVFNWMGHGEKVKTVGLALVLVKEGSNSLFRRIGLVETEDQKWSQDAFPNCQSMRLCIV